MKRLKYIGLALIFIFLIWYFFIKQYDYLVRFEINTSPGNVYKSLEEFNFTKSRSDSFSYRINDKVPFSWINEDVTIDSLNINFDWKFNSLNDSTSLVKIGLTENQNSLFNRLTAPFIATKFKRASLKVIKDFKTGMDFQLKEKIKVTIKDIDTIPSLTYAYIELENVKMEDKAKEMIKNNATLLAFITEHGLKKGNFPFVIIEDWNLVEETIDFRYCFPIVSKDTLPLNSEIKYDKTQSRPALKAEYNGNYRTSDRGWFALDEYAKRHNLMIQTNPIEFFKNDPHIGGNELEWVAEIYMPLK